jgi:hypothetical protein
VTVVGSLDVFSLPTLPAGSPPPLTVALLVTVPVAVGVTLSVITELVPFTPIVFCRTTCVVVQVTIWPTGAGQVQLVPVAETNVRVAGSVSFTVIVPELLVFEVFETVMP